MSIMDELIFNRVEPGKYDWQDFNRVGEAVEYILARLTSVGCMTDVNAKTDWDRSDVQTRAEMAQYLQNVRNLRAELTMLESTPQTPETMRFLTYQSANAIEKILFNIDDALNRMPLSFWGCNEIGCGEQ